MPGTRPGMTELYFKRLTSRPHFRPESEAHAISSFRRILRPLFLHQEKSPASLPGFDSFRVA